MCIGGPLRLEPQILAKLVEQSFSNHRFEILLHLKIKTRPRKEFLHFICSYGISNLKLKNSLLKVTVSPLHINITFVRKRLPNPKSGKKKKKTRALSVLLNQNGAAWKKVPGLQCNHPPTRTRAHTHAHTSTCWFSRRPVYFALQQKHVTCTSHFVTQNV